MDGVQNCSTPALSQCYKAAASRPTNAFTGTVGVSCGMPRAMNGVCYTEHRTSDSAGGPHTLGSKMGEMSAELAACLPGPGVPLHVVG